MARPLPDPEGYEVYKVDDPLAFLCDWDVIAGGDACPEHPSLLYESTNPDEADTDYFYLCWAHSRDYEELTA